MEWLNVTAESGLWGLLAASFLAATVLPGGSEALLWGFLRLHPAEIGPALMLATLGNTAGGMTSWWCGRYLPRWQSLENLPHRDRLDRWGSPLLLLAWAPLIGDALPRRRLVAPARAVLLPVHGRRQVRPLLAGGPDGGEYLIGELRSPAAARGRVDLPVSTVNRKNRQNRDAGLARRRRARSERRVEGLSSACPTRLAEFDETNAAPARGGRLSAHYLRAGFGLRA